MLAVVLYNGEEPWTTPLSSVELFKPMEGFTPPDFRYRPEELRPVEDVTSGGFASTGGGAGIICSLIMIFEENS